MGLNYYWKEKQTIPVLHIGKASAGWTFSFQAYRDRGLISWGAWKELLLSRGTIIDERGNQIPADYFFKSVEERAADEKRSKHAVEHPEGSFLDPEGHSFSEYDFS